MLDSKILLVETEIDAASTHLAEITAAMNKLKIAGMYEALPHFQWQTRNGNEEKKYLYLLFHQNSDGSYAGPDGKRKVYIGADPANIAEAKRLSHNYETWRKLQTKAIELTGWINQKRTELSRINRQVAELVESSKRWPCTPIPTPELGQPGSGITPGSGPNNAQLEVCDEVLS